MARTPEVLSVLPDAAPRFSVRHRIILLVAVLGAAAAALGLTVVPSLAGPDSALGLPWMAWVGAFALAEVLVVHVQLQKDSHSFSLTDLVLVAGLYLLEP